MKLNECVPTKSFSNIVDVKKNCKDLYQNAIFKEKCFLCNIDG